MGLSQKDKRNILADVLVGRVVDRAVPGLAREIPDHSFKLYAWRPGSDDVKLIFAVDDESAARIAVQTRIDYCEMTEQEALEHVTTRDMLARVDTDAFFQGESPLWDGLRSVGGAVSGD